MRFAGAGTPTSAGGGYVYLRNRWYDPQTGRFLSQDPIGLAGGVNLYAYAGNNPASYDDPYGLCPTCDVPPPAAAAGAGAGAEAGAAAAVGVEALGGSALAGLFLVQDELPDEKTYATYTRTNAATGEVYVGRTSGYGTAEDLIKKRATSHPDRLKDFGPPVLDQSATGRDAYAAIRGREQQLIDANGGIGSPHVANRIRAVAKLNPGGPNFHLQSNNRFGEIAPYTGSMGFMFKFLP